MSRQSVERRNSSMHKKPSAVRPCVSSSFSRDDAVSGANLTLIPTDATLFVAASPEDGQRRRTRTFRFFLFLLLPPPLHFVVDVITCNLEQRGDPIRPCHQPFNKTASCTSIVAVLMPNQPVGQTSDHDATYIACSTFEFAILGWPRRNRRFALASACAAAARPSRLCRAAATSRAPRCVLIAAPAAAAASP